MELSEFLERAVIICSTELNNVLVVEQLMQLASDPKHTFKNWAELLHQGMQALAHIDPVAIPDFWSAQFRCRTVC